MPHKVADGSIKVYKNGVKYIKVNGKWEYVKKPRENWRNQPRQLTEEKIEKIHKLFEEGRTYDYISKTLNCNKSTIAKYCRDLGVGEYNYPTIKIPENMRETEYPGYYITEDGNAYRKPGKHDRKGQHGEINDYGLIYLKPGFRGHAKHPEYQYECINISIYDENGKFAKQIKRSIHQLVATAFVPNPEGYTEILHLDDNNRNNHYTNLKWGTHLENMSTVQSPATIKKSYTVTDMIEGKTWSGYNLSEWIRSNYELLESRSGNKKYKIREYVRKFSKARSEKYNIFGFKVEY